MLERHVRSAAETPAGELPPPSAELDILAALTHAYLKTISPKKRRLFMAAVEETMAQHEALSNVTRIRPASEEAAKARARRQAFAWMRMAKGVLEAVDRDAR